MEPCNLTPTPTKEPDILSTKSSSATLSLKRLLQKTIRCFIKALPTLEGAEKSGVKHVVSLANLLEQRECVERVEEMNVGTISKFPDLKSRLLLKISSEAEKEINTLKTLLAPLKEIQHATYQVRADILSLASQRAQDIDPVAMYMGTATIPPLASLMDSVQMVEKEARELYCSRMFYLEEVPEKGTVTSDNLNDLWREDDTKIFDAIKDCQELVTYFLEEKL